MSGDSTALAARPKPRGFAKILYRLRYQRFRYRQFCGIAFAVLLTVLARPSTLGFGVGAVLVAAGVVVRLWASGYVKKDQELATAGPYAYVRHPLYVGNFLLAFGLCAASGLWWSFPLWLLLAWAFYPPAIRREDAKLRRLFPEQWDAWRARTLALIPSRRPYAAPGGGGEEPEWSFRQSLVQNGEPVYAALFTLSLIVIATRLGA